jgi:hypothetical protein
LEYHENIVGYDGDTVGYHGIYKQQSDLNLSKNGDTPKIEIPQKRQFEGVTVVINHGVSSLLYWYKSIQTRQGKREAYADHSESLSQHGNQQRSH